MAPYAPLVALVVGAAAACALFLLLPEIRRAWAIAAATVGIAAFAVMLPLAWGSLVDHALYPPGDPRRVEIEIVIPPGASARSIGDILAARGVVSSPTVFALAARLSGDAESLRAGRYRLARGIAVSEALEALRRGGLPDDIVVTIPEGWTLRMIAARLDEAGLGPAVDFLAEAEGLEGYLFPDTYRFRPGASAREIIEVMRRRFDDLCDPALVAAAAERGLDRHGLTTLASIVEREARVRDEMPLIAGVFHNRLRRGMPLGADPTIVYALGKDWKAVVTYADLEVVSPYNTYRNVGLPPGPIGAPGRAALEAAAHPASTEYLYFVARADGTGRHDFARTLAEHERNRREAKRRAAR